MDNDEGWLADLVEPNPLDKIQFDRVYSHRVGGVLVMFGRTAQSEASSPVIFGAAFSAAELHTESTCGYGATEAEAVADLFRQVR